MAMIEGRIPKDLGTDATEIPGARRLLTALEEAGAPWAVVTSGSNALITGWLGVLQLAHPKYLVVAEDVQVGKPDPSCYLLGRSRLGLEHSDSMLVIEDAPSGVRAGKAAGFKVLALATTHGVEELKEAGADWIIKDLDSASFKKYTDGKIELEVWDTLQ
ncbi:DL-glycerol-3-phosphatase [Microsporum audouinii]